MAAHRRLAAACSPLHFATWVPSLTYTSVASSTALVATQPVWAALIARATGQHVPRSAWLGMAVAFAGVLRADRHRPHAVGPGVVRRPARARGRGLRRRVRHGRLARAAHGQTTTYTFVCYGTCSLLLLVLCLVRGSRWRGTTPSTWVKLLALTAGAQLLGHSLLNLVLQTTSPTVVSLAILFEMPGAALIAALWLGQRPPWGVVPAALLLLAGVALVVRLGPAHPGRPARGPPG